MPIRRMRVGGPGSRSGPDEARLVQRTGRLASLWLPAERLGSLKPAAKARDPAAGEAPRRPNLRDAGPDHRPVPRAGRWFFQAVFDPKSALLRVDLAVADAPTMDLCDLAILARLSAKGKPAIKTPLNLGCFFDPGEYRFEINAFAVEGEPFLDLYQELNPFGAMIRLEGSPPGVGARLSRLARLSILVLDLVGAIRPRGRLPGNYLERRGRVGWEYPQHRLVQHRSLGAYRLVEGEPRQTKVIQQSDGPVKHPHAVGRHLDASFYRDLEQCHVAFVFTHGGPIDGVYQVRAD